jgi:CTP synthase
VNTYLREIYWTDEIEERHRYRYLVNRGYADQLIEAGLVLSGRSKQQYVIEAVELPVTRHPFYVGGQCHPEYKSRLERPHPLFAAFLRAMKRRRFRN